MEVELKFVWKKLIRGLDLLCKRGCTVIGANTPLLREEEERKSRWRPTRETILEGEDKREQNGWEVLCKYSLPRKLTRRLVWKIISFLYQQRKGESKTRILVICIRWNYWQTTRIELLSIDPNRWNDDRNEIFRSTRINILRGDWGQNGTKGKFLRY